MSSQPVRSHRQPPNPTAAIVGWYPQGGGVRWLFQDQTGEGQSLLPTVLGSNTKPAAGTFSPSGSFGWNLDGENSVDSANTTDISLGRSGHAVRFFPVRDSAGNLIPNTWLVTMDYEAGSFENADYQDNVYLVTNIRPATQAPAARRAGAGHWIIRAASRCSGFPFPIPPSRATTSTDPPRSTAPTSSSMPRR